MTLAIRAANERIRGVVRVGRRTKELVLRLRPGEIPLLDHEDLDELAAQALLERRVRAVLDARPAASGRYPNPGPDLLLRAGVPLVDNLGEGVFERLRDGEAVEVRGHTVLQGGRPVAVGRRLTPDLLQKIMEGAQDLSEEWSRFLANTLEHAQREKDFFTAPLRLPPLRVSSAGRQALVVVRGHRFREDLRAIAAFVREERPVLIGVDGGADALIQAGFTPDLIVGDMDSISDAALTCGAELVVHAYPDGRCPGMERLRRLGLPAHALAAVGTSEDLALLLAYEMGAELIVAVGTHSNLVDFLEKGRSGMASTLLVRLKIGSRLVDARGVSLLYQRPPRPAYLLTLFLAALLPPVAAVLLSPELRGLAGLWLVHLRVTVGL